MEKPCLFPFTHNKQNVTKCVKLKFGIDFYCATADKFGDWLSADHFGVCDKNLCDGIIYKQMVINDISINFVIN